MKGGCDALVVNVAVAVGAGETLALLMHSGGIGCIRCICEHRTANCRR